MTGYMPLKLPRIQPGMQIIDKNGNATREWARFWDEHCTLIEAAIDGFVSSESRMADAVAAIGSLRSEIEDLKRSIQPKDHIPQQLIHDLYVMMPPAR